MHGLRLARAMMAALIMTGTMATASAQAAPLVISEVLPGDGSGGAEFVEVYNASPAAVSMAGWRLERGPDFSVCSSTTLASLPRTTLAPGAHVLLASQSYTGPVPADAGWDFGGLSRGGGRVSLIAPDESVGDAVRWGDSMACAEGSPAPAPPQGSSIARRSDWVDTDDNGADFQVRAEPQPQNMASAPTPRDTDLDGRPDGADNCVSTANADQLNTDGDAQGDACDADDDADGFADTADACPLVAGTSGGCPPPAPAPAPAPPAEPTSPSAPSEPTTASEPAPPSEPVTPSEPTTPSGPATATEPITASSEPITPSDAATSSEPEIAPAGPQVDPPQIEGPPPLVGRPTTIVVNASDLTAGINGLEMVFDDRGARFGESACQQPLRDAVFRTGGPITFKVPYTFTRPGTHTVLVTVQAGACGLLPRTTTTELEVEVAASDPRGLRAGASAKAKAKKAKGDACGAGRLLTQKPFAAGAKAVICLMNAERRKRGIGTLRRSKKLLKMASGHNRDMLRRRYFLHEHPTGPTLLQRMIKGNYRGFLGENLGYATSPTAGAMMLAWMNSPLHKANVLQPKFRFAAVAIAIGRPDKPGMPDVTLTVNFGDSRK